MSKNLSLKIALNRFHEEHGDCRIEQGEHKVKGKIIYLVVTPQHDEDIASYYLLVNGYKVQRKICGCIGAPEDKKMNSRCLKPSGQGTDHKGQGFCNFHKKHEAYEKKFRRKFLTSYLGTGKGKAPIYLSLLDSMERQPVDAIKELENLFWHLSAIFFSKIKGLTNHEFSKPKSINEDGKVKKKKGEEIRSTVDMGQLFIDDDKTVLAYHNELKSMLKDLNTMRREIYYSPLEVFKWLDEVKFKLEKIFGNELAREIVYHTVNTKGLLNKAELAEDVTIDNGFLDNEESLLKALPLGYADKIEEAEWKDIEKADENL